ncbi:hypothetical protein [Sphingomonas sp. OTU376]|uniref:hypothetical protein n=1 Tax=Sphingomonas sp. OTU376 TaxID=3043863 RepID=UPI00313E5DE4
MTLFLVLAIFAGFYALWLVFRLAVHALPFYAGLGAMFWLLGHDHGYIVSVLGGLGAGILLLVVAELAFALIKSPVLRACIALAFALPAAFAGYHAAHGIAGLAIDPGLTLDLVSWTGGLATLVAAWRRVTQSGASLPRKRDRPGSLAPSIRT